MTALEIAIGAGTPVSGCGMTPAGALAVSLPEPEDVPDDDGDDDEAVLELEASESFEVAIECSRC